jgi:sec-independent protein translocase protein TatA
VGPRGALGAGAEDELGDGELALVLHVGVARGIGREHPRAGRVDVVLARLVEVGEDDGGRGEARPEPVAHGREQVVAVGRAVEGRVRDHHRVGRVGAGRGGEDFVDRGAEVGAAVGAPGEPRAREREGVDEGRVTARGAEGGGALDGAEVGEIGVVDEIARDRERGVDDQRAGALHGRARVYSLKPWRGGCYASPRGVAMFGMGAPELLIILVIVVLLFGAAKIPELGRSIGSGLSNFKRGLKEGEDKDTDIAKRDESGIKVEPRRPTASSDDKPEGQS